ncbi:MAG: single-stranded DNA-binding protein [Chitinophagales bacterium]|nr:single-stranded DNA-binding protein [Chitinophagales bacterium]MCZ2392957.1 single-stranded DNA-binding protein [Chitinophagales bacterium]
MRGVNKVMLIGRVGTDPELRKMENSRSKLNLRIATTESYKNPNGEWNDITDWHTIVMWGPMAERGEKDIKKGGLIYVEGKIRTRSWEDKEGHKRYATEVIAEYYQNLSPRENYQRDNSSLSDQNQDEDIDYNNLNPSEDKLPF